MTKHILSDPAMAAFLGPMHPFRGFGHVDDIARAMLFLCSPENSYMTGVMMPVDGGYGAM